MGMLFFVLKVSAPAALAVASLMIPLLMALTQECIFAEDHDQQKRIQQILISENDG